MRDKKKLTPERHEYCIEDGTRMVKQIWRWKLIRLNISWKSRETHMQSLCSRRSGEAARLSSWHRGDTLSRWGKVSRIHKMLNWISSTRFANGCSGLLGLTNLYQPLNVGILKGIFTGRPLDRMFSHMFSWSALQASWGNDFCKKHCLYFSFLPRQTSFHANGRINEAYIFFYETTFPQELKNWQHLSCYREVSLIYPNIITVRGVIGTQITWKARK